jgi:hypothetical protein
MKQLFQKVKIEDFEGIQTELKEVFDTIGILYG